MEYINILIVGTATKLRGTCKKKLKTLNESIDTQQIQKEANKDA